MDAARGRLMRTCAVSIHQCAVSIGRDLVLVLVTASLCSRAAGGASLTHGLTRRYHSQDGKKNNLVGIVFIKDLVLVDPEDGAAITDESCSHSGTN